MKKILSLCAMIVFAFTMNSCKDKNPVEPALGSGTFVSKTAENKAVLLEEYTGINCGFCPDGHRIADSLSKVHTDRFFQINIHAGSLAPRFTIPVGEQLAGAFSISSYPSGVLNRQRFQNTYGQSRGSWRLYAQQILNTSAYANIAAKAEIVGRKLTVKVQVYFTDDSKVADGENYVHIALLQDNIWDVLMMTGDNGEIILLPGPQAGGQQYYPEMWNEAKGQYKHNHMLRAMITGLNGESVGKNTKGTFYAKIFTYDIPQKIDYEDIVLKDLSILAFITEKNPTDAKTVAPVVINVCKSTLSIK